jgi:hypothetical protein
MAACSFMGEGLVEGRRDDQCTIRNRSQQAYVLRCIEIPQVSDPRRRGFMSGRELARSNNLIVLKSIEVSFSRSPGYGKPGTIQVGKPWKRVRF